MDCEQYNKLLEARIPIIFYYGDYMENGPEDIMSSGFWSMIKAGAFTFAEAYNAAGGDATVSRDFRGTCGFIFPISSGLAQTQGL